MPRQSTVFFKPCAHCGSSFRKKRPSLTMKQRFCSEACSNADRVRPPHQRVWDHVDKSDDCWQFTGDHIKHGYGVLRAGPKGTGRLLAHRVAFEHAVGMSIPAGFEICHTCDTPACVRNDEPGIYLIRGIARPRLGHLWLGTHMDNMTDSLLKGRLGPGLKLYHRQHPEARRRGDRHHGAKLSADIVLSIRTSVARGASYKELAERYSVSRWTIKAAATGKNWSYLGEFATAEATLLAVNGGPDQIHTATIL